MLKKILMVFILSCLLPTMAHAWTLNTWARSGGGSITVDNGTPQTVVNSSVFKTYTTSSRLIPVTIAASSGYSISALYYNTTDMSNNSINNLPSACIGTNQSLNCTVQGPNDQNVWATFAPSMLTVTASAGTGGSVNLTSLSNIYYGTRLYSAINFTFTPQTNFNVQSITINGTPAATFGSGVTVSPSLPAGTNKQVVLTFPVGYTFTTNIVIAGIFSGPPIVNISPPQTVLPGTLTTIGSQSTGAGTLTYSWTQVSGPASVSTSDPTKSSISFTPTVTGIYTFSLTVTGSMGSATSTTTVTVTGDLADALRSQCYNCHVANGIGVAQNVFGNWSSSAHKINGVVCYTCHVGANTGGHPGSLVGGTVNESTFNYTQTYYGTGNFCVTCHVPSIVTDFNASAHYTVANFTCGSCHNDGVHSFGVHNPSADCFNCHTNNGPYAGAPYYLTWPPAGFSFHNGYTSNMCVNCHSLHNPGNITGVPAPHFGTYSSAQFVTTNIVCNNCHMQSASPGNVISTFKVYSANTDWSTTGKANPKSLSYIGPGQNNNGVIQYNEAILEAYDFKTLGTPLPATPANTVSKDCVRCHTTTGFVNYVTPTNPNDSTTIFQDIHAWGTTTDRTREMINCSACHNSDSTNGFDANFSRRNPGLENPGIGNILSAATWYTFSSSYTKKFNRIKYFTSYDYVEYPDSKICIVCHAGRASGFLIKDTTFSGTTNQTCLTQDHFVNSNNDSIVCRLAAGGALSNGLGHNYWSNAPFIDPHGMGSADNVITDGVHAGYEFRSNTAYQTAHYSVPSDISNSNQDPCVGCHMSAPKKHVFTPLSSSSTGTISGITSNICSVCHDGTNSFLLTQNAAGASTLNTYKQGYNAALNVITTLLANRGVYYNPTLPPYFFTTGTLAQQGTLTQVLNWNSLDSNHQGANLMGAAFNLRLLDTDAGWVHNGKTSMRLIYDSIDYLDDGNINSSVAATITSLYVAGKITQTTETNALAYISTRP